MFVLMCLCCARCCVNVLFVVVLCLVGVLFVLSFVVLCCIDVPWFVVCVRDCPGVFVWLWCCVLVVLFWCACTRFVFALFVVVVFM